MRQVGFIAATRNLLLIGLSVTLSSALIADESSKPTKAKSTEASETAKNKPVKTASKTNDSDTEYLLRYQFKPNQFAHYKVQHVTTMHVVYGEIKQTTRHTSRSEKHFRVITVSDNGTALLEPTLDQVVMSAQADDNDPIVFDSSEGPENCPEIFRPVLATVGKPSAPKRFSASGQLLSKSGSTTTSKRACSSGQTKKSDVDSQVDPQRNFLISFPEKPIKVGDSWSEKSFACVSIAQNLKKKIPLRKSFTLKSVKDSVATIETRIAVLVPIKDPAIRTQFSQKTPQGTIQFDIEKGQILARETKLDNLIIGAIGPKSSLHTVSQRREVLVTKKELSKR
ncbi:MAG: hypothetical protein CMJ78_03420 [Planctomycetaceae bacterium]|nr:hypothetical protein [Planctomycetaceae bacterium]